MLHRWTNDIAPSMASKGLEVVAAETHETRKSMLLQINELHLIAMMDIPPGLSQAVDGFKEKWLEELAKDSQRGVSSVDGYVWVVGRKPLA